MLRSSVSARWEMVVKNQALLVHIPKPIRLFDMICVSFIPIKRPPGLVVDWFLIIKPVGQNCADPVNRRPELAILFRYWIKRNKKRRSTAWRLHRMPSLKPMRAPLNTAGGDPHSLDGRLKEPREGYTVG